MKPGSQRLLFDSQATYRIRILGNLSPQWADTFGGLEICERRVAGRPPVTTLTAQVIDQASLMGVLTALYDMGYTLLDLKRLPDAPEV